MKLYPEKLQPTCSEPLALPSGLTVPIQKTCPKFDVWRGDVPFDRYGKKQVLDFQGEPLFAELLILRLFQQGGWRGVWVDSYRRRFLVGIGERVELPEKQKAILEHIYETAGSRGGCFDVYAWQDDRVVFAESKWSGHDEIRDTQGKWLDAALRCNLPAESFLIVEWSVASVASLRFSLPTTLRGCDLTLRTGYLTTARTAPEVPFPTRSSKKPENL
jgi:hypothetical protein